RAMDREEVDPSDWRDVEKITTLLDGVSKLETCHQVTGMAKVGEATELTGISVDFAINLIPIRASPMVGRIGDRNIGFFYDKVLLDTGSNIRTGEPKVTIHRKSLDAAPWTYVVDGRIDSKYRRAIKVGLESWNSIFRFLGLGEPIKALCPG